MIKPSDLGTDIKAHLEATGATNVSFVESDFELPRLEVVLKVESDLRIELYFEEGDSPILRIDAMLLTGLSAQEGNDLELVLRMLNEMNRLEGTPWKLWLKGMKVELEGVLAGGPLGEVWATWSIPSELLAVDDLSDLCRRFAEHLERVEIPGLARALGPLQAE